MKYNRILLGLMFVGTAFNGSAAFASPSSVSIGKTSALLSSVTKLDAKQNIVVNLGYNIQKRFRFQEKFT